MKEGEQGRVKDISDINENLMNTVQNIPLWTVISVTPSLFLLSFVFFSAVLSSSSRAQRRLRRSEEYGGRAAWERPNKRATTPYGGEQKKQQTKRNRNWTQLFVIHEKKRASLLTCTIKASFAKRKCSSLFLAGQKG